jgi:hypothetical protein
MGRPSVISLKKFMNSCSLEGEKDEWLHDHDVTMVKFFLKQHTEDNHFALLRPVISPT